MMSATVATAVLGYVFWIVAARVFSTAQVGIASAVISLCSTVALLTYLGPAAMLVERLHTYEQSRAWKSFIVRTCARDGGGHGGDRRGGDPADRARQGVRIVLQRERERWYSR